MTSPHPPSGPATGPAEQIEPAWNPGGQNLSYINKVGKRRIGGIALILPFTLGTWQVYRLKWKEGLIKRYTDNLREPDIILPSKLGQNSVEELDHRKVLVRGRFRHDQEMLVGPRMRDGNMGYHVITPIERDKGQPILVNRGWIDQAHALRNTRPQSVEPETTIIRGLVRSPPKKGWFLPKNDFEHGKFYFVDVPGMAAYTGSEPILVDQTFDGGLIDATKLMENGIPIGRYPGITLRNAHFQYIVTWYSLAIVTTGMCYFLFRKPKLTYADRMLASRAFGQETARQGLKGWS